VNPGIDDGDDDGHTHRGGFGPAAVMTARA